MQCVINTGRYATCEWYKNNHHYKSLRFSESLMGLPVGKVMGQLQVHGSCLRNMWNTCGRGALVSRHTATELAIFTCLHTGIMKWTISHWQKRGGPLLYFPLWIPVILQLMPELLASSIPPCSHFFPTTDTWKFPWQLMEECALISDEINYFFISAVGNGPGVELWVEQILSAI